MVAMRLPPGAPADLQQRLYDDYRIEIPVSDDARLIRASIQGYNGPDDVDALKSALEAVL
jgi:selenocysteine lyase/cysteine desulfurase